MGITEFYPIKVNVLGTEERNANTFNKFTIYIVEVTISEFAYKIFIRYREMIQSYMIKLILIFNL